MKKKFITKAATLAVALLMTASFLAGCGSKSGNTGDGGQVSGNPDDVPKPAKISMMATTIMTPENGLQFVQDDYKNFTGIELSIEKPPHNQYYEKVNLAFAGGTVPDVIEMGSTYYPNYASYGALWDMTEAWESSTAPVKEIVDEAYVDALRIDGRLYGFPMTRGNGTVTYVRGDWMDELGISNPTNYDEFINMLRAFKNKRADIIPLTAAGLINSETPYDIYLREFYQDGKPNFYKDPNTGQYIDGMSQPAIKESFTRMRDAYKEGLIDREIVTNKTATCRDKLYADMVGCFNYWAGYWNVTLEENLDTAIPGATLKALEPIAEAKYVERPPTAMVVTSAAENPLGVYKYLVEYSHDGGQGQMLFTHGAENKHWKKEADGSAVALPYIEDPDKTVEKSIYSPELSITKFEDPIKLDPRIIKSLEIFSNASTLDGIPKTSETITNQLPELDTIRKEVIAKIVLGECSVDEGIAEYEQRASRQIADILGDLNAQ